ncbi:hypothetical protein [Streptomyces huasconensis]|uniref:hypothetical protein n=1 Tax=Streptomyces huasconensis TaxID=1854574 RepID=UPI0033F1D057
MHTSAEAARQASAFFIQNGRLLCMVGVLSICCAAASLFLGLPPWIPILFVALSATYLLGEKYRRSGVRCLSEATARKFGFASPLRRAAPGSVDISWARDLLVSYGMRGGTCILVLGAAILAPVIMALGKEVRTTEQSADWPGLLALSASLILVAAVLVGEGRVYAMVTGPAGQHSSLVRPLSATLGWAALALLPVAYVSARAASAGGEPAVGTDILPIYAVAVFLAMLCLARGNRVCRLYVRAKTSRVVQSPDEVQPHTVTLLLRPFHEDHRLLRDQQMFTAKALFKGWFSVGVPEEQKICNALDWAGPTIAVGTPGEYLAPDGATRFYLPPIPGAWHAPVSKMMARARLVVVILGDSEGLAWELTEAFRVVPPQRLVLVVPVRGTSGYARLQQQLREAMRPHLRPTDQVLELPAYGGSFGVSSRAQGIIYFTSGWQAVYAPLRGGFQPTDRLTLALVRALAPVAQQLHQYEEGAASQGERKHP